MDSAGFDSARWDHWLLIVCFVAIATYGLWSTWQWKQATRQVKEKGSQKARAQARLARRLAIEIPPNQRPSNNRARSLKPYSAVSNARVVEASGRFRAQSRHR